MVKVLFPPTNQIHLCKLATWILIRWKLVYIHTCTCIFSLVLVSPQFWHIMTWQCYFPLNTALLNLQLFESSEWISKLCRTSFRERRAEIHRNNLLSTFCITSFFRLDLLRSFFSDFQSTRKSIIIYETQLELPTCALQQALEVGGGIAYNSLDISFRWLWFDLTTLWPLEMYSKDPSNTHSEKAEVELLNNSSSTSFRAWLWGLLIISQVLKYCQNSSIICVNGLSSFWPPFSFHTNRAHRVPKCNGMLFVGLFVLSKPRPSCAHCVCLYVSYNRP